MSRKNHDQSDPLWTLDKDIVAGFMAEALGTAVLLFIGCMGCIGTMGITPPPPIQTALTFGLTINLIIMMLGHISGAHLNPVVTLGAVIYGLKSIPTAGVYVVAQFIGATVGYGMLKAVTPHILMNDGYTSSTTGLCETVIHPGISTVQAILVEALCTSIVLCTACATWDPRCARNTDSTALRFGFAVAGISFAASPYTGCSMNPARTFAPSLWNGSWNDHWVYWVGPIIGGLLGTFTYKIMFDESKKSRSPTDMDFAGLSKVDDVERFSNHE